MGERLRKLRMDEADDTSTIVRRALARAPSISIYEDMTIMVKGEL